MIIFYRSILIILLAFLIIPSTALPKPLIRTALLIGNSIYPDVPMLSPAEDISKMAKALEKSQFKITKETNLNQNEMREVISKFGQHLKESRGIGIFYYAGYAVQVEGENYLIPVNAVVKSENEATAQSINLSEIIKTMQSSGTMFNIVILEACYQNPFGKKFIPSITGLAEIKIPDDFLVMAACSPGKSIRVGKTPPSRFTDAIASYLSKPGLELMDIANNVKEAVSDASKEKQVPWISSSIKRGLSLNFPRRDFFYLLKDMQAYKEVWKTKKNLKEIYQIWKILAGTYPSWFSKIDSGDSIDVIIQAMNDDLEGIFYEMVHLFEFDLTQTNSLGMKFVYIPPGKFVMGSQFDEPERGKDEQPHSVTIPRGFFIHATEITQGQWQAVMGSNPSHFDDCGQDCPVENVSWNDVRKYIDRLNMLEETNSYRLPTEAEWEYTARAGSSTWFFFGNDAHQFGDYAWYKNNSGNTPHPVAQKEPNQWGLYDVHGNSWEWCQNWAGPYPSGSATNPTGPGKGNHRVVRGGSWFYGMLQARSANRFYLFPDDRNYTVGFRLVQSTNF